MAYNSTIKACRFYTLFADRLFRWNKRWTLLSVAVFHISTHWVVWISSSIWFCFIFISSSEWAVCVAQHKPTCSGSNSKSSTPRMTSALLFLKIFMVAS